MELPHTVTEPSLNYFNCASSDTYPKVTLDQVASKWLPSTLPWQCSCAGQMEWKFFSSASGDSETWCATETIIPVLGKNAHSQTPPLSILISGSLGDDPVLKTIFLRDDHSGGP